MAVFVAVAHAKGFRAAAANLKLGPGSVSEAVHRLEDRLGVQLFNRSTRSVALTSAGERLYEKSAPAIPRKTNEERRSQSRLQDRGFRPKELPGARILAPRVPDRGER